MKETLMVVCTVSLSSMEDGGIGIMKFSGGMISVKS
jgi:hypothetical protein